MGNEVKWKTPVGPTENWPLFPTNLSSLASGAIKNVGTLENATGKNHYVSISIIGATASTMSAGNAIDLYLIPTSYFASVDHIPLYSASHMPVNHLVDSFLSVADETAVIYTSPYIKIAPLDYRVIVFNRLGVSFTSNSGHRAGYRFFNPEIQPSA